MKTVKLTINGHPVEVEAGTNILNAAQKAQIKIPSLCYHPDLPAWAACGICAISASIRGCFFFYSSAALVAASRITCWRAS